MKALVISPQPFFSPRGTPLSVYYRTLVTAELGVEVDLLTYGHGQDVHIPKVKIIRIPRFAFLGNVRIGPSLLKLWLDMVLVFWTVALLLRQRYNFVHAHEEAVFFCLFLKPIFRFKLVYDMHSSLPQQLTNFRFTTSKFLICLFKKLEQTCLSEANAIITICPDLSDYVNQLISDNDKHFLIENSIFDPVNTRCAFYKSNGLSFTRDSQGDLVQLPSGKRFIVYAGTLEPYQGIDILLGAFKKVITEHHDVFLCVVGGNAPQVKFYSALARKYGIRQHCVFTGQVPQSRAKQYSRVASVLVSPRRGGTNTPLKIYEQLASGIPLVATRIHSHTQVLNDEVAILVEAQPDDLARGILRALDSSGYGQLISSNALRFYKENYSRSVYLKKMKGLLAFLS